VADVTIPDGAEVSSVGTAVWELHDHRPVAGECGHRLKRLVGVSAPRTRQQRVVLRYGARYGAGLRRGQLYAAAGSELRMRCLHPRLSDNVVSRRCIDSCRIRVAGSSEKQTFSTSLSWDAIFTYAYLPYRNMIAPTALIYQTCTHQTYIGCHIRCAAVSACGTSIVYYVNHTFGMRIYRRCSLRAVRLWKDMDDPA
jgi:hypothetical protein